MNIVRLNHVMQLPAAGVADTAYYIESERRLFFYNTAVGTPVGWAESRGITALI